MTFLLRIGQFAIYTMSKGIWEMNPASIGGPGYGKSFYMCSSVFMTFLGITLNSPEPGNPVYRRPFNSFKTFLGFAGSAEKYFNRRSFGRFPYFYRFLTVPRRPAPYQADVRCWHRRLFALSLTAIRAWWLQHKFRPCSCRFQVAQRSASDGNVLINYCCFRSEHVFAISEC